MTTDTAEWVGAAVCDGRYRVLRKLGEGGMAHVYLAYDDKLEREVVIKVARTNLVHDSGFTGRFTREVRSLAKLGHPHIVPLIDIGQHDGAPFAVMNYLTGGSLRDRQPCENNRPLPAAPESLHAWLPAIAQALDFVHKNKFIHRDVKPENILFDADGQPFLADLGIIKALSEPEDPSKKTVFTGAGMVLGTPQYMAPELILGEEIDGRVDQYALAVTVYEMLAGKPPFAGTNAPAIFIQQTTKPPQPLREIVPQAPEALAAAVDRALAKSPKERFATCVDFVHAALGHRTATIAENRTAQEPILATLLEPRRGLETPSDLRNPTRAETAPSRQPAPARSSKGLLVGGLAALALVVAGVLAFVFVPRGEASLKLAAVQPLAVTPGEKQPIRIEFERQRLDGEVTFWLEGLPEGVKAEPVKAPTDQNKAIIDLTIAGNTPPGKTTATLRAKCRTVEASMPIEVAVNAPLASLRFLPIAPCAVKAGETATVTLNLERKNCDGPVVLALEGLPKGVVWNRPFFNAPVIPADQVSYPLELKADPNVENEQTTVKVVGKLKSLDASGALTLTVFASPGKTADPKLTDPTVKTEPKAEPKPDPIVKTPMPDTPAVAKADLYLSPIVNVTLRAGERRTVWVQIERYNCKGQVDVAVAGLPAGVTVDPTPLPPIGERRISLPFDVVAAPTAPESKTKVTVSISLGDVRKTTSFNVGVVAAEVVENREVLWQKSDRLANFDPFDRVRRQSRSKSFPVFLKANQTYVVEMASDGFDGFVRVETREGDQLAAGGGGRNSRITVVPTTTGTHYVIATSAGAGDLGTFTLKIR